MAGSTLAASTAVALSYDPSSSLPRSETRTRRRLPPTPSLPPGRAGRSSLPAGPSNTPSGSQRPRADRQRLAGPVCCRCNRQGKCKNCLCVKQGRVCTNCLPSRAGGCQNLDAPAPPTAPVPASVPLPPAPILVSASSSCMSDPTSTLPSPTSSPASTQSRSSPPPEHLPSWSSIFALRSFTLQHIPKGARDAWAEVVHSVFSAINLNPADSANWRKLFLLPRCVLTIPSNGDRLGWRELLDLVRRRIRKWQRGDILVLWEEAVASVNVKRRPGSRGKKRGK